MSSEGRVMGLDVGDVRTGVALSDPLGMMALPYSVVQEGSLEKTLVKLKQIIDEVQPTCIVAGLPLDREGQPGPQARKTLAFLDKLRALVSVEIVTQDERFSTAEVQRMLIKADVSRKKRKQVVDKIAATHILQTYLDRVAAQRRQEQAQ
jgi:putative Holliday junction resolvase